MAAPGIVAVAAPGIVAVAVAAPGTVAVAVPETNKSIRIFLGKALKDFKSIFL